MVHPHVNAIEKMDASSLIGIIEESKVTYVRENLSIFLHENQVKLLKQVKKHEKPHHKRIRIKQFKKAEKDDLFNMHLCLYLRKYQKLEKIGLIEITSKGNDILDEISSLEKEWENVVNIGDEDLEVLRKLALDSFEISYNHKKKKGFIF